MDFRRRPVRSGAIRLLLLALLPLAALTALTALVVAPAPAYDPWAWLLWGREIADGSLSTTEGPAFKPLPVAVTTALSPLGAEAAPAAWVLLARAAALAAIALAFVAGRRLAGSVAGVLAVAGVALCGAYPAYAASGDVTGLFVALVLGGALAWWDGRPAIALGCAIGCALLRVEAWPFALAVGVLLWRREPALRRPLAAAAALVPAAWLVPESLGSGDVLRSGERARVPNPGQPAEADVPALAALEAAIGLPLWPLLAAATGLVAGVLLASRTGRGAPPAGARTGAVLAVAGGAWIGLVAVMAQAGFSGEPRYALPGAALVAVAGAVAVGGLPRAGAVAAAAVVAVTALPRVADLPDVRADQAHQWRLSRDLASAIDAAGGRAAILRCGTPYVGRYRGPLLAYRLQVAKARVEPDAPPAPPGTVFRSRLRRASAVAPSAAGFPLRARRGRWEVRQRCGDRRRATAVVRHP